MGIYSTLKTHKGPSIEEMMEAQGHVCSICRQSMRNATRYPYKPCGEPDGYNQYTEGSNYISYDHVIPDSLGGRVLGNVLLAHPLCNRLKDSDHPSIEQLALLAHVNTVFGWNGRYYANTHAREVMMRRRRLRGMDFDYRDDPRFIEFNSNWSDK